MEIVKVAAELRNTFGKKANKASRKTGGIPGVIYGGDNVLHFTTSKANLKKAVYTPDFKVIELELDGKTYKCILKDIQFHPVTDNIVHVDFLRLIDGVSINVEVPVKFAGVSPGVLEGGQLIQSIRKIKLKTTPEALVDHVLLDISNLKLGFAIRVKDITPMDDVQIMNAPNIPVASVEVPRALRADDKEEEEEGGEGEEATEGGEEATERAAE